MTNRPSKFDGEPLQTDSLAPENENPEQTDHYRQADTVAGQGRHETLSVLGLEDSEKLEGSLMAPNAEDLVDRMRQMTTSGVIDMSAYAGEPNHDDNVDKYGWRAKPDGLRGDGT